RSRNPRPWRPCFLSLSTRWCLRSSGVRFRTLQESRDPGSTKPFAPAHFAICASRRSLGTSNHRYGFYYPVLAAAYLKCFGMHLAPVIGGVRLFVPIFTSAELLFFG